MRLVIPIFYGDKIFTDCELVRPGGRVIADTKKIYDQGKIFNAYHNLVAGCITELSNDSDVINDKRKIREITLYLKQKAIEKLAIDIMLLHDDQDAVEGFYICPRCGQSIIAELSPEGIDTRDFISELEINDYESEEDSFTIELEEPYNLKKKNGDVITSINSLSFRHNTIQDCIEAHAKYGSHDKVRAQYDIYVKCLTAINGTPVEDKWKKSFGMFFFEEYNNNKEVNKIAQEMNKYGLQTKVEKNCLNCGKVFKVHLNTANFFDSALL
jgi:hypothetical protein